MMKLTDFESKIPPSDSDCSFSFSINIKLLTGLIIPLIFQPSIDSAYNVVVTTTLLLWMWLLMMTNASHEWNVFTIRSNSRVVLVAMVDNWILFLMMVVLLFYCLVLASIRVE